ncbi:MAG: hypothetical protein ABIJ86_02930 [Spirochaetota bacterium]
MEINRDFKELLESLNSRSVEYLLVGAYALAFHGIPRNTGDMDIWVNPDPENAERVVAALDDFGFGDLGLTVRDFTTPDMVVQLGVVPSRVDMLTSISGVAWPLAWQHRQEARYGSVPIFFLGRDDFIDNKRSTGRPKDMGDIALLTESNGG